MYKKQTIVPGVPGVPGKTPTHGETTQGKTRNHPEVNKQ